MDLEVILSYLCQVAYERRLLSFRTVSLSLDPTAALRLRSPLLPCRGWQGFRKETAERICGKTITATVKERSLSFLFSNNF